MIDALRTVDLVIGLIITLFTVGVAIVLWLQRRMRAIATAGDRKADASRAATAQRLIDLETDVEGLRTEVQSVNGRLGHVERSLETVARVRDVDRIRSEIAEMRGSFTTHMAMVSGQVDTLYKAALRAGGAREPDQK